MSAYYMMHVRTQGYNFVATRELEHATHSHIGTRIPSIFVNGAQANPFLDVTNWRVHPLTENYVEHAYRWTLDNIRNRLLNEIVPSRIDWYKKNDPYLPGDLMPHYELESIRRYQDYYPAWLVFNQVYRNVGKTLKPLLTQSVHNVVDFVTPYPEDIYDILSNQKFVMLHTWHDIDLHFPDGRTHELRGVNLKRFPLDSGKVRIASPNGNKHSRMTLTCIGDILFDFRSAANFLGDTDVEWQVEDNQLEVVVQDGVLEYEISPTATEDM